MQISSINSNQGFGASIKKTEQGNEYKSTNVAKVVMSAIGIANFIPDIAAKRIPQGIIGLGIAIGLGFLLDYFVDKTRQNDADIFAQTGEVKDKTRKGLGIGAAAGACYGGIHSLAAMATSKTGPKLAKLGYVPLLAISGLIHGTLFYDLRVNKSRKELSEKAKVQSQIQQAISEYKETEELNKQNKI